MDDVSAHISEGKEPQKWDHPWKTSEIRKHSANWTLAGDIGLLNHLQEFSQQLISRTHETEKLVDDLVHNSKRACAKVNNVINDFQMLSNIQFVENRVYDEEVEEPVITENGQELQKTKEQREAEMLPRVKQALELGLSILDEAFHKIQVEETSDSEDEERGPEGRIILEPKDPYENRPLPYIIGSEEFLNDDYVGLRDFCEEGAVEVSVEDESISVSSSSEEEEESQLEEGFEDLAVLNNVQPEAKIERISKKNISDDSGSESSDLFELGGDENGYVSPSDSFEEEKTRRNEQKINNLDDVIKEVKAFSAPKTLDVLETSVKKQMPLNDDTDRETDLFASTENDSFFDEEDSPFLKKTGLFSTDAAVFKTEKEEIFDDDLFGIKKKEKKSIPVAKEIEKNTPSKNLKRGSLLFSDDDDEMEQDIFSSYPSSAKPVSLPQQQNSSKNVDKDILTKNSGSFDSATGLSNTGNSGTISGLNGKTTSPSLFGDDSDSDDLFSAKSKAANVDYGFEDDNLFYTDKKQKTELKENKKEPDKKKLLKAVQKSPSSLFDDDSLDLFSPSKTSPPKMMASKKDSPQDIQKPKDFVHSMLPKSNISLNANESDISAESPKSKVLFSSPLEEKDSFSIQEKNYPANDVTDSHISFDDAIVGSNTLNVINKDRAKIPGKRRKPTRKGRQAALLIVDSSTEENSVTAPVGPRLSRDISSLSDKPSTDEQPFYSPQKRITKPQHVGLDKNIMSQLVSEISSYKIEKNNNVKLGDDITDDLFSVNKDALNKPNSSFLSPKKDSVESNSKLSKSNSGEVDTTDSLMDILGTDTSFDDDLFSDSSFKGFKTAEAEKQSFLNMDDDDDDDDDIFKAVKGIPLKTSLPVSKSSVDIFDEPADIFAGVQKENYDMFPTHLYDVEDDIFGNFENPPKLTAESSSNEKIIKNETAKAVPVDIFDDPLSIMSSGD